MAANIIKHTNLTQPALTQIVCVNTKWLIAGLACVAPCGDSGSRSRSSR